MCPRCCSDGFLLLLVCTRSSSEFCSLGTQRLLCYNVKLQVTGSESLHDTAAVMVYWDWVPGTGELISCNESAPATVTTFIHQSSEAPNCEARAQMMSALTQSIRRTIQRRKSQVQKDLTLVYRARSMSIAMLFKNYSSMYCFSFKSICFGYSPCFSPRHRCVSMNLRYSNHKQPSARLKIYLSVYTDNGIVFFQTTLATGSQVTEFQLKCCSYVDTKLNLVVMTWHCNLDHWCGHLHQVFCHPAF